MNKLIGITIIAIFLFALPCSARAWEVEIINGSSVGVEIEIYGEHLFWRQVDCKASVPSDKYVICQMPWGICPVYAEAKYTFHGTEFNEHVGFTLGADFAACYNTQFSIQEIRGYRGDNSLEFYVQPH